MATVDHIPTFSTFDPLSSVLKVQSTGRISPSRTGLEYGAGPRPVGSRYETVPHNGPGTAYYCRQPSQSELKRTNGMFASPNRPFYYPDPQGLPFIDTDGNKLGRRWICVDPKGGKEEQGKGGCCIM